MNQKIEFDYRPLTGSVPFGEALSLAVKDLRHHLTAVVFTVFIVSFLVMIWSGLLDGLNLPPWLIIAGLLAVLSVASAFMLRSARQRIRLQRFAMVNGLSIREYVPPSGELGMIFDQGHSRQINAALVIDQSWLQQIGNYRYVTGSGKNQQTHNFGFLELRLPRKLPHMVLDARANNFFGKLSNLPTVFDRDQVLRLEGNFNDHFTLYAPRQYETDALYVFTPDVMQVLIDEGSGFDMEVVGDRMYLYSSKPFRLTDPEALGKIFAISRSISSQLVEQVDYYADSRVGDRSVNMVAEPGRRLKAGVPWFVIAIVVLIVVFQLLPFILANL